MLSLKKIFLVVAVSAFSVCAAHAQTRKIKQAKAWKQFQTVIARSDKTAVAEMIEFPFEASIIGGELNFKVGSKTDFIKSYTRIFNAFRRKAIVRGRYISTPGEDEFGFEIYENGAYHVFTFCKISAKHYLIGTMAAG